MSTKQFIILDILKLHELDISWPVQGSWGEKANIGFCDKEFI